MGCDCAWTTEGEAGYRHQHECLGLPSDVARAVVAVLSIYKAGKSAPPPIVSAIDTIHASRKRSPIEWPEAK